MRDAKIVRRHEDTFEEEMSGTVKTMTTPIMFPRASFEAVRNDDLVTEWHLVEEDELGTPSPEREQFLMMFARFLRLR